jgi:uncharacterized membrane protein YeaQ/YmgE (transglycosylase-associated protein family)
MQAYSKAIAALGAFIGVLATALADGTVSSTEWGTLAAAAAGVVGVFFATNKPAAPPVAPPAK